MRQHAYGLAISAQLALTALPVGGEGLPELVVEHVGRDEADARFSGPLDTPAVLRSAGHGGVFVSERGRAGDHRFALGDAGFHLDAGAQRLACALDPADGPSLRALYDPVLTAAALLRGREALHAAVLELDGAAVAVCGPQDAGKTSLALALLAHGLRLVSDDIAAVEASGDGVLVHAGPEAVTVADGQEAPVETVAAGAGWRLCRAPGATASPLPLRTVVVLGAPAASASSLVSAFVPSGASPARRRARFELAAAISSSAALVGLERAGRTPAELAAAVIEMAGAPA